VRDGKGQAATSDGLRRGSNRESPQRLTAGDGSDMERGDGLFRVIATARPFENLVALQARWVGNRLGTRFPLNLLLEVEEHSLSIRVKPGLLQRIGHGLSRQSDAPEQVLQLRVRLRHCYVRYRSAEIDIIGESKYESAISDGKFEIRTSEKAHALAKSQHALGLDLKAVLQPTHAEGSLGAKAGASLSRQTTRTINTTTTARPDIYEVRAVPNGWRVGHLEYGDPNKISSCLDGRYFHRAVAGYPHTCEAEFKEGYDHGLLTFTVTVRDGLHVERTGGGIASGSEVARAAAAMRDRIAALRLERHLRSSDHEGRADEEMPIATVTCEVVRAADSVPVDRPPTEAGDSAAAGPQPDPPPTRRRHSRGAPL
jgi:hypothetical protein